MPDDVGWISPSVSPRPSQGSRRTHQRVKSNTGRPNNPPQDRQGGREEAIAAAPSAPAKTLKKLAASRVEIGTLGRMRSSRLDLQTGDHRIRPAEQIEDATRQRSPTGRRRFFEMIVSYRDKKTERFANGEHVRSLSDVARQAETRLDRLESATSLEDLAGLPGNRLEALKGTGRAIGINDQWRICFEWPDGSPGPINVEIVDYH